MASTDWVWDALPAGATRNQTQGLRQPGNSAAQGHTIRLSILLPSSCRLAPFPTLSAQCDYSRSNEKCPHQLWYPREDLSFCKRVVISIDRNLGRRMMKSQFPSLILAMANPIRCPADSGRTDQSLSSSTRRFVSFGSTSPRRGQIQDP